MQVTSLVHLFLVVALGLFLSNCVCSQALKQEAAPPAPEVKKTPEAKKEVVVEPAPAPVPEPAPAPVPSPTPVPAADLRPIYFDLNKSAMTPDAAETLKTNLEWFRQNPGKKVKIEGNCDIRGAGKYNRALGQRRADATKKYLVSLGVDASLLETISYGKDKPGCKVNSKSCWTKERRVDFEPMP